MCLLHQVLFPQIGSAQPDAIHSFSFWIWKLEPTLRWCTVDMRARFDFVPSPYTCTNHLIFAANQPFIAKYVLDERREAPS